MGNAIFAPNLQDLQRYFLKLAYDGTNYSGWQIQPEVDTVQERIEKAIRIILPDVSGILGCGRTDAGVHASQFYAHFESELDLPDNLVYKMNRILPLDIAIQDVFSVDSDTHARFSATSRSYSYFIHFEKNPFRNAYSVFHHKQLDVEAMNKACDLLLGTHDFTSFSKGPMQTKTNLCDLTSANWEEIESGVVFRVSANRFLRNMVRAMVGTMLEVGEGKMAPEEVKAIVEEMDRSKAGKSAHPQGLFLDQVKYPQIDG